MNFKKLALSVVTSGMLVSMMGAGMTVSAHTVAKHASGVAMLPVVIQTNVITGKMDGKKGWPEFAPAFWSVPQNSKVELIIHSYDDGGAGVTGPNLNVKGTIGNVEYVDGKAVKGFGKNNVAHTITIPQLGLNIPIPPRSAKEKFVTVVAYFNVAKPGNYTWQCMAQCGSGASGWGGAMSTPGWMKGTLNVYKM